MSTSPPRRTTAPAAVTSPAALIGNTPLVRMSRLFPAPGPAVYLKMEQFNPGGSLKDRTALGMLRAEDSAGRLRPGSTIIESSSGNTAIGLAMLSKDWDCGVVAICDRHLPAGKRARLRALGADIVFLPDTAAGIDTVQLRIAVASRLADGAAGCLTLGQYSHPANPAIHAETTGPEIWRDLEGELSAVVVAVGTCGTISGVGRYLKATRPGVAVIGVEPEGSIIFGGQPGPYLVQGGGLDFIPSILEPAVIDLGIKIPDRAAFAALQQAGWLEGWMLGGTAGLVLAALASIRPQYGATDTLVGIVPDGGDRYIDTVYNCDWLRSHGQPALEESTETTSVGPELVAAVDDLGCSLNGFPAGPAPHRAATATLASTLDLDPEPYFLGSL